MKNKGFTLIELLVVVLIIGILAAIALPMYTKAVEKTRALNAIVFNKTVADAVQRLYLENPEGLEDECIGGVDYCGRDRWNLLDITPPPSKGFSCMVYNESSDFYRMQTPMCFSTSGGYVIYTDAFNDGRIDGPYCVGTDAKASSEEMCNTLGFTKKVMQNCGDGNRIACGGSAANEAGKTDNLIGDSLYSWAKP